MVFVDVAVLCLEDEVVFQGNDFLFHGITEAYLESRADLLLDFFFDSSLNGCEVENFSFWCTLISVEFAFFGEDGFSDFFVLEFDIIECVETDDFRIQGFIRDVKLFEKILGMESFLSGEFFEYGVLVHLLSFLLRKLI